MNTIRQGAPLDRLSVVKRKLASLPKGLAYWLLKAGWRAAVGWTVYRTKVALGIEVTTLTLKPLGARFPVLVRLGDTSDMDVFAQIFMQQEYTCVTDLSNPHLILDLGANVGYTSAYFASRYPTANIIAVEPDPANFELCRRNLAPYGGRVTVLLGAVWPRRTKLRLSASRAGWASQVHEVSGCGEVEAWDIASLMELSGESAVDLLKCDIEGSEAQLFESNSQVWLRRVRNICIELHGDDCRKAFMSALRGFEYAISESGELTLCRDLRPARESQRDGGTANTARRRPITDDREV